MKRSQQSKKPQEKLCFDARRLCDLTGVVDEDVATSNPDLPVRVSLFVGRKALLQLALCVLHLVKTVINCFYFIHIPTTEKNQGKQTVYAVYYKGVRYTVIFAPFV